MEFAHAGAQSFSNVISGTGSVTKTGAGKLELSNNNTYSGGTIVNDGVLLLTKGGHSGTLYKGTTVTVNGSNAVLAGDAGDNGDVFGYGANSVARINLNNGGSLTNYSSTEHITVGAVIYMNNGIINTKDPAAGSHAGGNFVFDNAIYVTAGTNNEISVYKFAIRHLNNTSYASGDDGGVFDVAQGAKLTISSIIIDKATASGTTVPLVKRGAGTLTLSGANTYTQPTTVSAGTLKVTGAGTLGTGAVTNNATLEFNNTNNGVQITNTISGSGALIKSGSGTVELTQALTGLTGNTTITGGGLTLSNTSAASTLHNLSGGSLEADGANSDVFVNLTSSANLTLNNTEMTKFIGSITASGLTITKTGDETLKIYTGASGKVQADSLVVSSGELDFKGYMTGGITVGDTAPGVFSPGNSIGEATFGGDYILNDNGKLLLEIAGSDYTDNDILIVNGDIILNGGEIAGDIELALSGNALSTLPFTFDVVIGANNDGDISNAIKNAIVKNFDWPFSNITVTQEGTISSSYTGDVTNVKAYHIRGLADANAVPEPSTWALLILGAAGLLYWRKRKSNK